MRSTVLLLLAACEGAPVLDPDAGREPDAARDAGLDGGAFDPGARFEEIETSGEGPWAVWGYAVALVDARTAIVFGGTNAGGFGGTTFDAAWRVNIGDGELTAVRIEATGPPPRYCNCAAYDRTRDRVVVFGGRDLSGPLAPAETWELDVEGAAWTPIDAAVQPVGTLGCAMTFAAGSVWLFGGASAAGPSDETFRYDPSARTWEPIDAEGPVPRYDPELVPTAEDDGFFMFGGSYSASGAAFYADLWRFDASAAAWSEIELPEGPPGRRTPWVVRDPDRAGLYVAFGYDGSMSPMRDLWYADLDALRWTELELAEGGAPSARGFAHALPGGDGALGTIFGGYGPSAPRSDAFRLVR